MNKCDNCGAVIKRYTKKNELRSNEGALVRACSPECREKLEKHFDNVKLYQTVNIAKVISGLVAVVLLIVFPKNVEYTQLFAGLIAVLAIAFPSALYNVKNGKTLQSVKKSSYMYGGFILLFIVVWFALLR